MTIKTRHYISILTFIFLFTGVTVKGQDERSAAHEMQVLDNFDDFDDTGWWRNFNDSLLDSLITAGESNNYNVAMAMRRINVAKYALQATRAGYFPSLDLDLGWTKDRISGATASRYGAGATTTSYFTADVSLSWEIDLFGRITAQAKADKANIKVSRAEYEAAMVALRAQIATAYFQLRVYQQELEIAKNHSESELKIVKIAEARHETGLASQLDVSQAKMVYYSTVASIPQLENSIRASINSIAILLGCEPKEIYGVLNRPRPLPDYFQIIPSYIPMQAMERRPDVVEARYNIEVAAAQLGIAKKDYLPSLTLTGSIGTEAHRLDDLFKKDSFTYSIVPTLSWTIFDGLSRRADVLSARESMEIEIDNYNLTLLTAFEEADNALSGYFANLKYIKEIEEVIANSIQAEDLSLQLYKQGLGTFTNVVDAQISYLQYENQLIEAQGNALNSLVSLYKALGGGWQNDI